MLFTQRHIHRTDQSSSWEEPGYVGSCLGARRVEFQHLPRRVSISQPYNKWVFVLVGIVTLLFQYTFCNSSLFLWN